MDEKTQAQNFNETIMGSCFLDDFLQRILLVLDKPQDCFHFSLVCKQWACVFSKVASVLIDKFSKTGNQWILPHKSEYYTHPDSSELHGYLQVLETPCILPNGMLHGNIQLWELWERGEYYVFGKARNVQLVNDPTCSVRLVSNILVHNWYFYVILMNLRTGRFIRGLTCPYCHMHHYFYVKLPQYGGNIIYSRTCFDRLYTFKFDADNSAGNPDWKFLKCSHRSINRRNMLFKVIELAKKDSRWKNSDKRRKIFC